MSRKKVPFSSAIIFQLIAMSDAEPKLANYLQHLQYDYLPIRHTGK